MKAHDLRKKLHETAKYRVIALLAIAVVSLGSTSWADALYILTGLNDTAVIVDDSGEMPDLSSQLFYMASSSRGYDITLTAGRSVYVTHDNVILTGTTQEETISQLLARLGLTPSPLEMVAVDMSGDDVKITVSEDITYYDKVVETEAYPVRRIPNASMPKGTERIAQTGVDGLRTSLYEVVWSNGELVSRQLVEELGTTAVECIVEYGTDVDSVSRDDVLADIRTNADGSGTLVFASGDTMTFSSAKSMVATAYTGGVGRVGFITATGTHVKVGTIAVDVRVIPLGTRMFVVTRDGIVYGMGTAEDTGVVGNIVDLYHDTYNQCINFGRRDCVVYILD